ncbi:Decapping nuclease rai1 [Golovinomyces cichoracearum]|uniref:Decapping nuclease n=1 Tax=Golovinomyces cichoracearum TaxID=62708 RepID=A0A420J1N7_9PEZI|nr:Decapping nuclease rai1 [Golovinomyces cichoracearum]
MNMSYTFDTKPIRRFSGYGISLRQPELMAAIFDDRDGFEMNMTLFQMLKLFEGHIVCPLLVFKENSEVHRFIEENHEYKLQYEKTQMEQTPLPGRPSQKMMRYWGYKFESLCLSPNKLNETSRDHIMAREENIVNNHAQYCSVVKTGFGNTSMILGGEVDGIKDVKSPDDAFMNWIELKTSADVLNEHDARRFERKLMKFWIQSYLLGVPKIIIGFRTHDGFLSRIEEFDTLSIPRMVRKRGNSWDAEMCLNFASDFLNFLRSTITENDELWRIRRKKRSSLIEVFRVEGAKYDSMLSDDFIRWRLRRASPC